MPALMLQESRSRVTTGKPVSEAELKAGDVILTANGSELSEVLSLNDVLMEKSPGDSVTLLVRRQNEEF